MSGRPRHLAIGDHIGLRLHLDGLAGQLGRFVDPGDRDVGQPRRARGGALDDPAAVNLFGPWGVTQAFLRLLTESRGALVTNVSLMALAPLPLTSAYAISMERESAAIVERAGCVRLLLAFVPEVFGEPATGALGCRRGGLPNRAGGGNPGDAGDSRR